MNLGYNSNRGGNAFEQARLDGHFWPQDWTYVTEKPRYQPQALLTETGTVQTFRGVDPLTGLPVLMYQFSGKPTLTPGDLESENIPGLLSSHYQNQQGQVVVAYSPQYQPVQGPLDGQSLLHVIHSSAQALHDAAQAGVVHGDIRPERFLMADNHLLLEGFGVRWNRIDSPYQAADSDEPSYAGDVYAWARSIQSLSAPPVPSAVQALLEQCTVPDPEARPSAQEILTRATELLERKHAPVPEPSKADVFDFDIEPDLRDTFRHGEVGAGSSSSSVTQEELTEVKVDSSSGSLPPVFQTSSDEDGILVHSDPGRRVAAPVRKPIPPSTSQSPSLPSRSPVPPASSAPAERLLRKRDADPVEDTPGFVKNLPPGATYRSGSFDDKRPSAPIREEVLTEHDAKRPSNQRIFTLGLLVVSAAVLALLLLFYNRMESPATTPTRTGHTQYIVNIDVHPDALRNVTLLVVSSPAGSERRSGHELTFVPGAAILDQSGVWRLQGRFQNQLSEIVTLDVPSQRSATLVFPTEQEAPPQQP